jgi:outer membrane murein-binding lipoprotein Lpp
MVAPAPKTVTIPTWVLVVLATFLGGGGAGGLSFITSSAEIDHLSSKVVQLEHQLDAMGDKLQVEQVNVVELRTNQSNINTTLGRIESSIAELRAEVTSMSTPRRR